MSNSRRYLAVIPVTISLFLISGSGWATGLKVAFNSDWAPYSVGSAGEIKGILPDLIREILKKHMDVPVEIVGYPWARVQHLVEKGDVDAFVTVPTAQRLKYALSSAESVYQIEMRTTVRRDSSVEKILRKNPDPEILKTLRYCDILGNGWGKAYATEHGITPTIGRKVSNCLRMVQKGRSDVVLQPSVVSSREIAAENLGKDLVILPTVYGQMTFTLLLSKKSSFGQAFLDHFDQALQRMKADGSYLDLVVRLNKVSTN